MAISERRNGERVQTSTHHTLSPLFPVKSQGERFKTRDSSFLFATLATQ
jgi:hypothetical protein